jgi:mono/diheme cytochrome c family protein
MIANTKNPGKLFSAVRGFMTVGAGMAAMAGLICLASARTAAAGDTNAPAATVAAPKAADTKSAAKPDKKTEARPKKELSGAELYAIHCNRCHAERYPAEFTDGQWKTLMLHMRVRANLPAKQAKLILEYLQDESGHY